MLATVFGSPSVSVSGARVMGCSPSRPSGVLGDVMFLCRLMCFLLSGRLPFAMRLLPRYVVSAADLLSLSDSVSGARVICCSPSRLSMLWCVLLRFLPVTHSCAYASLGGYTLCSIPGMHSSALSSPTHVSKVVIHISQVKLSYTKSYPHKYHLRELYTHKYTN